jgi:hypothetical protein
VVETEQTLDAEGGLPADEGELPAEPESPLNPEAAPTTPEQNEQPETPAEIEVEAINCLFRMVPERNLVLATEDSTARNELAPALGTDLTGHPAWALAGTLAGAWSLQSVNRRQDDDRRRPLV